MTRIDGKNVQMTDHRRTQVEKMRSTLKRLASANRKRLLCCLAVSLFLPFIHLLLLHSFVLSARKTKFNCRIVERRRHKILLINDFHSTFGENADSQDNSPIKCVATWICAAAQRRASTSILIMKWGTMRAVVCTWYKRSLDFYYRIDVAVTLSQLPNNMKISQVIFDTERWLPSKYNSFQFRVTTCFWNRRWGRRRRHTWIFRSNETKYVVSADTSDKQFKGTIMTFRSVWSTSDLTSTYRLFYASDLVHRMRAKCETKMISDVTSDQNFQLDSPNLH